MENGEWLWESLTAFRVYAAEFGERSATLFVGLPQAEALAMTWWRKEEVLNGFYLRSVNCTIPQSP